MRAIVFLVVCAGCGRLDFDQLDIKVADAASDTPTDSAFPACAGHAGTTTPILIATATSPFCIDRTEVTAGQYAAFLASDPSLADQPAVCAFDLDYTPTTVANRWPVVAGIENLPIGAIDWCDARAYCAWAGKRLCGKIGGGPVSGATRGDPTQSEWTFACTMGGAYGINGYPYGPSYVAGNCVDKVYPGTNGGSQPIDVGTAAQCEGGFPGLFDMSGNITEWEDSCDATTGGSDTCAYRGGEYGHVMDGTSCNIQEIFLRSDVNQPSGGIRCCSDAL